MLPLLDWLRLGGPAMLVLLLLSIVALTLVIVKCWEFWELQLGDRSFVGRALDAWHRHVPEQAFALLASTRSPLAEIMAFAMRALSAPALSPAQAREQIQALALERLERLRSLFRPLELIAQLAPLLGLLGTVLGMIEAFQQLEQAGERVDPAILSGGIWQALLTTAAGLIIAIPSMAALSWLERRVDGLHQDLESALTRLLTPPLGAPGAPRPEPVPSGASRAY